MTAKQKLAKAQAALRRIRDMTNDWEVQVAARAALEEIK